MPLTLNLLHEEQALLKQRKRDPLKLGLYALVGVALLFVAYYGYRLLGSHSIQSELRQRQAKWAVEEPKSAAAVTQESVLNEKLAAGNALIHRIENRFYWAPVLASLLKTVTPNIQIIDFTGSTEGSPVKVSMTLDGIAADPEPRGAAEQFRRSLNEALGKMYKNVTTTFRSLDETKTSVLLDARQMPTAKFSLEVTLARPDMTAAPVPEEHRAKHP